MILFTKTGSKLDLAMRYKLLTKVNEAKLALDQMLLYTNKSLSIKRVKMIWSSLIFLKELNKI